MRVVPYLFNDHTFLPPAAGFPLIRLATLGTFPQGKAFSTIPVEKEQVALWKTGSRNLSKTGCGKVILSHSPPVEKKSLRL
jgi:hypothetical protein